MAGWQCYIPTQLLICKLLSDALSDHHTLIFILSYISMVPCANLVGFAGQEFARKVPHVLGVLVETTLVLPTVPMNLL